MTSGEEAELVLSGKFVCRPCGIYDDIPDPEQHEEDVHGGVATTVLTTGLTVRSADLDRYPLP